MEHAKKNSISQPSSSRHDEVVTRTKESTTPLMSGNSTTGPASNPLSAYRITDSPQRANPPPETTGVVESMEMALKILTSAPVIPALPGELKRYSNNVSDIQQAAELALSAKSIEEFSTHWSKCEILSKVLVAVLDVKQGKADCSAAKNALKQWVLSCILLKKTRQCDLRAYPESPAKTHGKFITWCLAVARAASTGTCTIGKDPSLEYLCYIKALNAGCAESQLLIVRDHLLGELYRETQSCQRFLPREAEAQLKAIAARKERLARLEGLDETHYEIIYDLVNLIRSDSKDRESKRDVLADRWIACKEYAVQQLAPMLYLQDAYGNLDTKKAHMCLVTISRERCEEIKVCQAFNLVYQYWVAEIGIANASISTGIRQMATLAADVYPAALYSLIEYGQSHNTEMSTARFLLSLDRLPLSEISKRLKKNCFNYHNEIIEFLEFAGKDRQCYFLGIMSTSYNAPLAYKLYTFWRGFDAKYRICDGRVNDLMYSHFRELESTIINKGTIKQAIQFLSFAYTTHEKKSNEAKCDIPLSNLYLRTGNVKKLRLSIHEIETKMPFVDDAQILVFRHFSDFLTKGKADEKLLDDAIAKNQVAACYRLLSLNHCTVAWGYNKLIAKLLEHTKGSDDFLNLWRDDAGLVNFINRMTGSYTLKYPEAYCQLMNSISKWISDKKILKAIYKQIAVRELIQGHESNAESLLKKARALKRRDLEISYNKMMNRRRILRSSMPKYYLDIYEAGFHWSHSCNLRYDFYTLLRTGAHLLKNNNDPAAHLAWCYRMAPLFLLKYISNACKLIDTSSIISAYHLQKKISSKIGRLNQEMMIFTAKRVETFLEKLPGDDSQTTVRKQLNEGIAEIRSIAKTAIPHQFAFCRESSAKSQEGNHKLSIAEPGNYLSECTMVTDDIYPDSHTLNYFYKENMNFITEHILAPKIRKARSLLNAMALFNQLNESDDFNSARFTVLLIDTVNRMETEFVPGVLERLCFCLDRFKKGCKCSVKCHSQYIFRYKMLESLERSSAYFSKKEIEYLSVELEALKTSIWLTYLDSADVTIIYKDLFMEEKSTAIIDGIQLAQLLNSMDRLLNQTKLADTDNALLIMRYIRSINMREDFEKQLKPGEIKNGTEMAKLIHNILTGKLNSYTLSLRCKKNNQSVNMALIWLALESGKINDAVLNKIVDTKLGKTSEEYHFLKCLLASKPATVIDYYTVFLQTANMAKQASIMQKKEAVAIAMVSKLLEINKIDFIPLPITTDQPNFSYLKAMLHWRHPGKVFLSDRVTMDKISAVLVAGGREAIPEASCRLLDFILEQESRGKAVSDITVYQCCRFIHARTFIATDEQTLYQGITLYLGKGCASDKEEGLQLINQALASGSPIPALRMARLQGQQLFPADVLDQDCLKLFAQKADTDQELYRDYKQVLFIELLLSLGESGLDWLIRQLESASGDDINSSRIAELFQKKLDIWRESGIQSTQQPSLLEEKSVAATVTSKQPSQSAVEPKSHPIRSKREKKGRQQEARQGRKSKSIPCPAVRHEEPVTIQQLLEQLVMKNKDKTNSEIPDEEITELLKLLEQLKRKNTTAIRGLSKNRLANLVRMLPWPATILGEVIAAHLKNMTDPHARANYARQQLERYECLITEQLTVAGDAKTRPQGAMAKTQAGGKLLMQQPVPPGVQELIKNTTQAHQEALLSGNLSKDELSATVSQYPDLYLHYLKERKSPEINCVKSIWEGLGTTSQTDLLIKAGAILVTDQCGKDRDSAIKILNDEKLSNDARLSLFESLQKESMETLLMRSEGIPDNLVRGYLERMKETQPKQKTTQHQIRSINQWQTSPEKRLTDNVLHLLKELPSDARESDKIKLRGFREALKKDMDSKIESIGVIGTSLTTGLAKRFKASAILMALKEIARVEADKQEMTE